MKNTTAQKYGRAFAELLFLRLRPEGMREMPWPGRVMLYALALSLFYLPILAFAVSSCIQNTALIPYFLAIGVVHALAKVMLYNSKRIQRRFSSLHSHKSFFLRLWLIVEYIVFMWVVYLFYPLACVLVPVSLLGMAAENLLGGRFILALFMHHPEVFIRVGGVCSYITFILADGLKKLRTGFLPDYLGLYALLSVISGTAQGGIGRVLEYFSLDLSNVSAVMSEIFSLSNSSMNLVASVMTVFFAVYSLYTSNSRADGPPQPPEDVDSY